MGLALFDELNRTTAAYCRALGLDSTAYETPLSPAEVEVAEYMARHGISRRAASMLIAVNNMPAPQAVMGPRKRTFSAVVEYARSAEQVAESERMTGASIQSFYESCRRRTIGPVFTGD